MATSRQQTPQKEDIEEEKAKIKTGRGRQYKKQNNFILKIYKYFCGVRRSRSKGNNQGS